MCIPNIKANHNFQEKSYLCENVYWRTESTSTSPKVCDLEMKNSVKGHMVRPRGLLTGHSGFSYCLVNMGLFRQRTLAGPGGLLASCLTAQWEKSRDQSGTSLTPTQEGAYSWRPGGIEVLEPESMERHNILEMLAYDKNVEFFGLLSTISICIKYISLSNILYHDINIVDVSEIPQFHCRN